MFEQIWLYNGTNLLIEALTKYKLEDGTIVDEMPPIWISYEKISVFEYPDEYTAIQPPSGIYEPFYFDGEKWIGTSKEDWEAANPRPPLEEFDDLNTEEIQIILEDLILISCGIVKEISSRTFKAIKVAYKKERYSIEMIKALVDKNVITNDQLEEIKKSVNTPDNK